MSNSRSMLWEQRANHKINRCMSEARRVADLFQSLGILLSKMEDGSDVCVAVRDQLHDLRRVGGAGVECALQRLAPSAEQLELAVNGIALWQYGRIVAIALCQQSSSPLHIERVTFYTSKQSY